MVVSVSLDVYLLTLSAAVLWALSMTLSKRGLGEGGSAMQVSLLVSLSDVVIYWGVLFFLYIGGTEPVAFSLIIIGIFFLSGTIGTAMGRLTSFAGTDRVGASINSAGINTRPLFATFLALFFLGELVNSRTVIGIVVLVIGLIFLSISRGGDIRGWKSWELIFPLGAATMFALSDVIRRFGLTTTPVTSLEAVALHETAGFVVLAVYVLTRRSQREKVADISREATFFFVGSGVFNALSLFLFFEALDRGSVAIVTSLVGTAPLFVAFFSYFLLGDLERITWRVVLSSVLIVAGAGLITVS